MAENQTTLTEQEFFDRNVNISYVDPELPTPDNKIIFKHYACSVLLYGFCVTLFWLNPWFASLMQPSIKGVSAREFLTYIYFAYLIIAPIIYFGFKPKTIWISHNIIIINYLKRIFKEKNKLRALTIDEINKQLTFYKPTYKESQSIILLLIKLFFGTQMLTFLFGNIAQLLNQAEIISDIIKAMMFYNSNFGYITHDIFSRLRWFSYLFIVNILFSIDVGCYSLGYFTESTLLKNRIKSVDNTPAGILFCLACYSPFMYATTAYISFFQDNHQLNVYNDVNHWLTWVFHYSELIFIVIFVAASVALFTKGSNLTNRGIVKKWPYSVVRHPAYSAKIVYWWFTVFPLFFTNFQATDFNIIKYLLDSLFIILSMCAWMIIYYFRALTEERHLMQDPEYREYVKKVKYRFIPGLW